MGEFPRSDLSDCLVRARPAELELEPLVEHFHRCEPCLLFELDHSAEHDLLSEHRHCAVRCPLTEVRPLSGRNPRAAVVRHSRRAIQRAEELPMSWLPFRERRTGNFVRRFTLSTSSAFEVGIQPVSSVGE